MRWIIQSSLKYRYIVIALGVFMMIFGAMQIRDAPIDAFPEFAPPRVEIQTEAFGLTTVETEEILTIPLEQVLAGTPGVDVLRSKTVPGLSSILLIFEPGTDIWLGLQKLLTMTQSREKHSRIWRRWGRWRASICWLGRTCTSPIGLGGRIMRLNPHLRESRLSDHRSTYA